MKMEKIHKGLRENFLIDCLPIAIMIFIGFFSVLKWRIGIIPALLSGFIISSVVAMIKGYTLKEIEEGMANGIKSIFPALLTIVLVGFIISSWIIGGIIPTMVFFGFKVLNFNLFLPSAMILTGVTALMTGTSFTSIGTIGVSLMIIGSQIGIPAHIVAGAIVSGAFLGDKMSPLSDTTNIASSLGKVDLFEHIRHMMWDTVPAFTLSVIIFERIGNKFNVASNEMAISSFLVELQNIFNINLILLLIPLIIIIMGMKKIPANVVLFTAVILGFISAVVFQPIAMVDIIKHIVRGVQLNFSDPVLTKLFSKGGVGEISSTVITIIFIGCIVGIIKECNLLENLLEKIKSLVKTKRQLNIAVFALSLFIGFTTGAQLLAIILPVSLFVPLAEEVGGENKDLTRIVESTGTVGITLVPWSVPGIFIAGTLNVKMEMVLPFLIFPICLLFFNFIFSVSKGKIQFRRKELKGELA